LLPIALQIAIGTLVVSYPFLCDLPVTPITHPVVNTTTSQGLAINLPSKAVAITWPLYYGTFSGPLSSSCPEFGLVEARDAPRSVHGRAHQHRLTFSTQWYCCAVLTLALFEFCFSFLFRHSQELNLDLNIFPAWSPGRIAFPSKSICFLYKRGFLLQQLHLCDMNMISD
jgi:hypothetical protein